MNNNNNHNLMKMDNLLKVNIMKEIIKNNIMVKKVNTLINRVNINKEKNSMKARNIKEMNNKNIKVKEFHKINKVNKFMKKVLKSKISILIIHLRVEVNQSYQ